MKKIDIVYIIDDDPIHVFVTKEALELAKVGQSIQVFENGKDAFDDLDTLVKTDQPLPDLILLDLNMPIWDGWDFLDEFTQIPINKRVNVYIVSSSYSQKDTEKAKKYELVSNFIVKPITLDKLKEELENI